MSKSQVFRTGRHCVFVIHAHLVFVTKYRRNVLDEELINKLRGIFASVCEDFGATLVQMNGEDDHVHLLVNYPPKIAISNLVNSLKGVSSRLLRTHDFEKIKDKLWGNQLWSPSYFASSCGGAPIEIIRKYIEEQRLED
jgi:putative transposase